MSRTSVPRVYLGKPYDREFWWSTAKRILNERYRGKFDHQFTRRQNLPDAAQLHKPSVYMVGTGTDGNVVLKQVLKYTEVSNG